MGLLYPERESGCASAADVIAFAQDRRVDQAPVHKRVDPAVQAAQPR